MLMTVNPRLAASHNASRRADCVFSVAQAPPCRAFTLLEVVVVITIFGILSSVALVRFAGAAANYRADAATQRIVADIALARARALATSQTRKLTFTLSSSTYTLTNETSLRGGAAPYVVALTADPYLARLTSVSFAGNPQLAFDPYGKPASAGTIRLSVGTVTRTLTVDGVTGQVVVSN